jgi:methionyl-tRNA formyltransferase
MAKDGAPLMLKTLRGLVAATVTGRAQNHAEATMAPPLKREDGRIEWARSAEEVYNRMRGFAPWPGAYTEFRGQTCHVWGKPVSHEKAEAAPPGAIFARGDMVRVVCGAGSLLELGNVKLEGRKEVRAAEFANGARLQAGERFGKQ